MFIVYSHSVFLIFKFNSMFIHIQCSKIQIPCHFNSNNASCKNFNNFFKVTTTKHFLQCAVRLLAELDSEAGDKFKYSDGWFSRFKARHNISLRRTTNIAQRPPSQKESAVRLFHRTIQQVAKATSKGDLQDVGRFKLSKIANMDQTLLPFCFSDGGTYNEKGEKTVWVRGGASGMEKRQCTVKLTFFADGEPRVKPLLIFRGKGVRIPLREKVITLDLS